MALLWICKCMSRTDGPDPLLLLALLTHIYSLGSWFNCTANTEKQTRVEAWIRKRYPHIWEELEALGHWVTMDGFGYRQYNINRHLDP